MRAIGAALISLAAAAPGAALAQQPEAAAVPAALIRVEHPLPLPISRLDLPPEDLGLAGALLATEDNQTTGAFMGQSFTLTDITVPPDGAVAAVEMAISEGVTFIATMADADTTLAMAAAAGERALILNAGAMDDRLRGVDCRANILHLVPSRAMLTDALAQFLMVKRWDEWFLIEGSHPADTALADAYRTSAAKFGARITETRVFEDTGGARRTDSGHVQVQAQVPVFTQEAADHDVVVAADESEVFSSHLPYHTWEPRPVTGSAGLTPTTWHPAMEAWGATQMQRRFERLANRAMRPEDYNAWMALRVIGEAAIRTSSTDPATLRAYIEGPDFQLAAFKGQALSFRDWDNQLRQPILLAADNVLVSVSPQDQYVHQVSPLDTLGADEPETECDFGRS